MKQITFSLLTVLMCFMTTKVNAYDIVVPNEDGLKIYYNFINNKTELSVTYYSLKDYYDQNKGTIYSNAKAYYGNIKIPDKVNYNGKSYKVTEIGVRAFYHCKNISVKLPDYLLSIKKESFSTASIETIIASDFRLWCETDLYNSEDNPFMIAKKVIINGRDFVLGSEIVIPNNIKKIGSYAFANNAKISYLTIGNAVESIGKHAFYGCRLLSVKMPNSVSVIGDYAFKDCERLLNINFSTNLRKIGWYAFWNCYALESVKLFNSLDTISHGSFYHCKSLKSINLPTSLRYIGDGAFNGCSQLGSHIKIPEGVESIGKQAFSGCSQIPSITFSNSIKEIGEDAFGGCRSIQQLTLPNSLITIGEKAFEYCCFSSVNIPASVKTIGKYAFNRCEELSKITFEGSFENIGIGAFSELYSWEIIFVSCMKDPPDVDEKVFGDSYNHAKLLVPIGTKKIYEATKGWKKFKKIEESALANHITNIKEDSAIKKVYSINGYIRHDLKHGLNIIRQSDGTTKKVVIK